MTHSLIERHIADEHELLAAYVRQAMRAISEFSIDFQTDTSTLFVTVLDYAEGHDVHFDLGWFGSVLRTYDYDELSLPVRDRLSREMYEEVRR